MILKIIHFKKLGKGLRELRGEMTLKQLGIILNLQPSYICDIENGNKIPSMTVIDRYSRKLETEIRLILGESSEARRAGQARRSPTRGQREGA